MLTPPPLSRACTQAVPLQRLREQTFVATAKQVARNHASWLRSNKHLRYMWLPYTDSVAVVQVNPDGPPATPCQPGEQQLGGDAGGLQAQQVAEAPGRVSGNVVQATVDDE
jgi:hypothetical protein